MEQIDNIEKGIQIIEFLTNYFENALLGGIVSSKTYLRVKSGLDYLKNNFINSQYGRNEYSYDISLADFLKIVDYANPIEVDETDIPVMVYMEYEEEMFKNILQALFDIGIDGINNEVIDKILENVGKMDKYINERQ